MCQIGREVLSFNHLSCFRHCLCCIAIVARHSQFSLLHTSFEVRHDGSAAKGAVLAHVPLYRHFTQCFFGSPPVVGDHSHKISHVQDLDNAAAIFNLGGIDRFDFAVEHWASSDCCMQHARQLGINAILTLAYNDVGNVNSRN